MAILYRIRPVDKKSVEAFYDVYSKDEQGNIRSWSVTETYRWGQGFVENLEDLPHSDDTHHTVDTEIGWGPELDDLCAVWFEFDDSFTDEEKAQIEQLWEDGGAGWLYDGEHDWQEEDAAVHIIAPYQVDLCEDDGTVIEENVKLKPRPKPSNAWPFPT